MKTSFVVLVFVVLTALVRAAETSVSSPNGQLQFSLQVDAQGIPRYQISNRAADLVLPSRLGLVERGTAMDKSWDAGLKVAATTTRSKDSKWRPTWGERAEIPDHYNELTIDLKHTAKDRGTLQIIARAYDEGIAFRYFFPEDLKTQVLELGAERTEFNLPAGTRGYWTPEAQLTYDRRPLRDWKQDC